jgi:hypothetical protein
MFNIVIGIIGCEFFTSLSMSSFQMLTRCHGFDFGYIESFIYFVFGYDIW